MATTWASATASGDVQKSTGKYSGIKFRSWIDVSISATVTQYSVTIKYGIMTSSEATGYVSNAYCSYSLAGTGQTTISKDDGWTYANNKTGTNTTTTNKKQIGSVTWKWDRGTAAASKTITFKAWNDYNSNCKWTTSTATYTVSVAGKDAIAITYNANGGIISSSPHKYGDYYYRISNNIIQRSSSSSSGFANYTQYFYYDGSKGASTVIDFINPGTFTMTKTGYKIETADGYALGSATGTKLNLNTATWSQLGGSNGSNNTSQTITSKTVYANWKPNAYTISFNVNGGDSATPESITQNYGTNFIISSNELPTRTGYVFTSYNTAADGSGTRYFADISYAIPSYNLTLYAQWQLVYTINFVDTDETIINTVSKTYGTGSITMPFPNSKDYYTFKCWQLENTDNQYLAGSSLSDIPNPTTGGIYNLNAVWEKNGITLLYKNKDDTSIEIGGVSSDFIEYGDSIILKTPTLLGYIFQYWSESNTSSDNIGILTWDDFENTVKTIKNTNVFLYANWIPITYTLQFNKGSNAASGEMAPLIMTYDKEQQLPPNSFERPGFIFSHWELEEHMEGEENKTFNDEEKITENLATESKILHLSAIWELEYIPPSIEEFSHMRVDENNAEDDTGKFIGTTVIINPGSYLDVSTELENEPTYIPIYPTSFEVQTEIEDNSEVSSISWHADWPTTGDRTVGILYSRDSYLDKEFDINQAYFLTLTITTLKPNSLDTLSTIVEEEELPISIFILDISHDSNIIRMGFNKSINDIDDSQPGIYIGSGDDIYLVLNDDNLQTTDYSLITTISNLGWENDVYINSNQSVEGVGE